MKTCVIYARYSSNSQTEQSIEGQLRVCEEYAKNNKILILGTYIDRAMTGRNDKRPDFQRMIRDSAKKEWDYVLVYRLDRFSRNKYETVINERTLEKNGVSLISATEMIPDKAIGKMMKGFIEDMNQYYSAELAEKILRGMRETRIKGNYQGGSLPYGYKIDGRKIVIDEEKVEIVKYIFEQYANGKIVRHIVEELTSKGIFNDKNQPFTNNHIYRMIKNTKYIGKYTCRDEVVDNMYPQMISQELFDKANVNAEKNHYGKKSIKTTYILKHKLICGYCGKPISAESGTSKTGAKVDYYKCLGRKKYRTKCEKTTLRKDHLEEFIVDAIIEELSKPQTIKSITKNLLSIQDKEHNENVILNQLYKEQKQAQLALDNIMKAIERGVINKTTNNRMIELENNIENYNNQILIEKSKMAVKLTEKEIYDYYSQALNQDPLAIISYFVDRIKLYNDHFEIKLNTPIYKSPDTQGFCILSKFKKLSYNYDEIFVKITLFV